MQSHLCRLTDSHTCLVCNYAFRTTLAVFAALDESHAPPIVAHRYVVGSLSHLQNTHNHCSTTLGSVTAGSLSWEQRAEDAAVLSILLDSSDPSNSELEGEDTNDDPALSYGERLRRSPGGEPEKDRLHGGRFLS